MTGSDGRGEWDRVLADFTRRNQGRHVRLEVQDAELGAQTPERDMPFGGVCYDPRDDRVEIMLSGLDAAAPHVTHMVVHPEQVEVMEGGSQPGGVLRIAHPGGQTLVSVTARVTS